MLKIGLVAPFEGRYRYVGYDAIYAARLAVREINAAGGVAGWSLELVAYDDRADPDLARATARNLVIDPDVVAAIGHYRQVSTVAAGAVYAEAGMPLLAVGAWLTPTGASIWHIAPLPEQVVMAMGEVAQSETGYNGESLPMGKILPFDSSLVGGMPPLDFLLVGGVFPFNSPLAEGTFLFTASPLGETEGGEVWREGTLFVTPYPLPQDLPGLEAWDAAYRDIGPHVPAPGIYALPTYEAVYVQNILPGFRRCGLRT